MNNRTAHIKDKRLQLQEKILLSIVGKDAAITIFDIGACEGENSIRYAKLFPNANIFTFEPFPTNFEMVQQNISNFEVKNVHPISICLSNSIGETSFYVSSGKPGDAENQDWDYGNKSSSLLAPEKTLDVHPWLKFEKEIKVKTTTLKQFCEEQSIAGIDFIHMDVQGAELMVLQAAQDFIHSINMIWLEVEAEELYKGQPLEKDIQEFMQQHHYIKIEDTVYTSAGDQFWVRQSYIFEKKGKWFVWKKQIYTALKKNYKKLRRTFLS